MNMRIILFAALLLTAAGCGPPMQWVKPGATAMESGQDLADCRRAARHEARYSDWYGYSGFNSWGYWPNRPVLVRDRFGRLHHAWTYDSFSPFNDPYRSSLQEESRLERFCMRAKGFELVPAA